MFNKQFFLVLTAALICAGTSGANLFADVIGGPSQRFLFVGQTGFGFSVDPGTFDQSLTDVNGGTTAVGSQDSFFLDNTIASGDVGVIASGTLEGSLTATLEESGFDNQNSVQQIYEAAFTLTEDTRVIGTFTSAFNEDAGLSVNAQTSSLQLVGPSGAVAGAFDGGLVTLQAGDYTLSSGLEISVLGLSAGETGPATLTGVQNFSLTAAVPEPSSALVLLVASGAFVVHRRRAGLKKESAV